jgi:Hg(II)-responsive transcriptional regulator
MSALTIGQLAKSTGVGIETIRFYERRGILPMPPRQRSGYRQFGPDAVARVQFIRRAQTVGFTLREIEQLLALRDNPDATRQDVRHQVQQKIADVDVRLRELQQIRSDLLALLATCHDSGTVEDCPILDALSDQHQPKEQHHGH